MSQSLLLQMQPPPPFLITIPPGECYVVLSNTNNSAMLIGPGANLTATNGLSIAAGQVVKFSTYNTSQGCDLYAIVATGGSSGPVSALVSTTD